MEIHVKESTMIRPANETPTHRLHTSDLDLVVLADHIPALHFYRRPNEYSSDKFFEAGLLKDALSKTLVAFYPMAGRLGRDENGRFEIQCNGEGVLFIEAETNFDIDDFGDLSSTFDLVKLVPAFDYSKHISSYPLVALQVTHFKCGGVCLGIKQHHTIGDATAKYYFINAWAEMTRGLPISITPFFDRAILTIGVPNSPKFHHIEYDPSPSMSIPTQSSGSFSTSILELSLDQINILKQKSNKKFTRYEILTAHIWRCTCKARGLPNDQVSKLHIPTNGRSKLNPAIPHGYIGNVVFNGASLALSGDIQSEPLISTVERVHKALERMDDEYLKSALAYLKQQPDPTVLRRGAHTFKCPNLNVNNLINMSMLDANFGWGRPFFARPVIANLEGIAYIVGSSTNDGSLSVVLNLETQHMQLFKKSFYEIFQQPENVRSRY